MKYLTTSQYRRSSDGMVTSRTMSDETLASFILRAETSMDTFMEFDLLLGGFEPHNAWYQQAWDQTTLKTRIPNIPVPVRNVTAYKIQVSNVSTAGAGFFANINPGDVTFNLFGQYVEIVPLQAVTYAMTPVLVALGMNPPVVQVDYQVGYYLSAFGDTLYDSGDGLTFRSVRGYWASTYTLATSIYPHVLPSIPPVVYVNGTVASSSSYALNMTEGSVTFSQSQLGNTVTCDYCYQIPDAIKNACIAQTSYLIGQSDLNLMGMSGLLESRSAHQELRRFRPTTDKSDGLSPETAHALSAYVEFPIA